MADESPAAEPSPEPDTAPAAEPETAPEAEPAPEADASTNALLETDAAASEQAGIFHPLPPRPSQALDNEKPPKPEEYEAKEASLEQQESRDELIAAEAKEAEDMGVFHPHSPTETAAITAEKPPKPEEYETADATETDEGADKLAQAEAEAAESMALFHPHSPSRSTAIDAEKPPAPDEYETEATQAEEVKERRASMAAMVKDEAAHAESMGVFHPHQPQGHAGDTPSGTPSIPRRIPAAPAPAEDKYIVKSHQAWSPDSAQFAKGSLNPPAAAPPQQPVKSRGCAIL